MKEDDVLRVQDYLEHIELAIARIHRYLAGMDRASFFASEEKQDAVIRNIEIIGEAAQSIRRRHPEFAVRHPEIPWGGVYGMRNAIAHGYFTVDLDVIWKTIGEDLPALAEQVGALRAALRIDTRTGD
ncbi:MAG: hypothetical protein A3I63_00020 [Betaproteobacteria bacterium RIFCSPLOWO2_02_FULL_66_14]|nr:MAG: hypothetical protein A3I63_00020 [Betaproteobacteria bacterium RIFCSPLOWO2_02_FULL_66_14]